MGPYRVHLRASGGIEFAKGRTGRFIGVGTEWQGRRTRAGVCWHGPSTSGRTWSRRTTWRMRRWAPHRRAGRRCFRPIGRVSTTPRTWGHLRAPGAGAQGVARHAADTGREEATHDRGRRRHGAASRVRRECGARSIAGSRQARYRREDFCVLAARPRNTVGECLGV